MAQSRLWDGPGGVLAMLKAPGTDANEVDPEADTTALMIAAQVGREDAVRALIKGGADVHLMNKRGSTALHFAALRGHVGIISQLVASGSDIKAMNEHGQTCLHCASLRGHAGSVGVFLGGGVNPKLLDHQGRTAFKNAVDNEHREVVSILKAWSAGLPNGRWLLDKDFSDLECTFENGKETNVTISPGDIPPNNAIAGSAEFSGDSTIDLGRIFMTQGTIAMWVKPNEVPADARLIGQIPLPDDIKAVDQTLETSEGKEIDIVLSAEGEAQTVNSKAIITKLPDERAGHLVQVPSLARLVGAGATVKHSERKIRFVPKPRGHGTPYATLEFKMKEGLLESSTGTITINVTEDSSLGPLDDPDAATTNALVPETELLALQLDTGGGLVPAFDAKILNYFVEVPKDCHSVRVQPSGSVAGAAIEVSRKTVATGSHSEEQALDIIRPTAIPITVTAPAPDSTKRRTYTVTVVKNDNAWLQELVPSEGKLEPEFDPDTTQYTIAVNEDVAHLTLTPKTMAPSAACGIGKESPFDHVDDGAPSKVIELAPAVAGSGGPGLTKITVEVTASDGVTKCKYRVSVFRGAAPPKDLDDIDPDEDIDVPDQPSGALRLAKVAGSDTAPDSITVEIWTGRDWQPLLGADAVQKGVIKKGTWVHLCLVCSETQGVTLYVTGERQLTVPCRFDFLAHRLGVGALILSEKADGGLALPNGAKNEPGVSFTGKICCVEFWQSQMLSEDEVQALLVRKETEAAKADPAALAAAQNAKLMSRLTTLENRAKAAEDRVKELEPLSRPSEDPAELVTAITNGLQGKIEQERAELDMMLSTCEGVTTKAKDKLVDKVMRWKYGVD